MAMDMKVHILNCKDGQLIQHSSVLLLKGQVAFETQSPVNPDGTFHLQNELEIIQNSQNPCRYKSFDSSFITIAKLSEGLNTFEFKDRKTGQIVYNFQLNYSPVIADFLIVPLYILSKDSLKDGSDGMQRKLRLGLEVIQAYFGEKLFEQGFSKRSFQIEPESPKVLHIDLTSENILEIESRPLWEYLAKVIRSRDELWSPRHKYVVFMADPWKLNDKAHSKVALGGGGLVLMGSEFLTVWPEDVGHVLDTVFNPEPLSCPDQLASACRFGDIRRTIGSLYAASLGSLAHEMGHIFDLGHLEVGLMGRQFHRMETTLSPVLAYPPISQRIGPLRPKVGLPGGDAVEDVVSIGHSCATILYCHRWFAFTPESTPGEDDHSSGPELLNEKISSKIPLTAIQLREVDDGYLLKEFTFLDKEGKSTVHEFTLAKNHIPLSCKNGEALVIAQDLQGNILKKNINRDILPQSFTVIQRR